jgi:hypothetical protein
MEGGRSRGRGGRRGVLNESREQAGGGMIGERSMMGERSTVGGSTVGSVSGEGEYWQNGHTRIHGFSPLLIGLTSRLSSYFSPLVSNIVYRSVRFIPCAVMYARTLALWFQHE